jgi:hypothetical protein
VADNDEGSATGMTDEEHFCGEYLKRSSDLFLL